MQTNKLFKSAASALVLGALTLGACASVNAIGAFIPTVGLNNQNPADLFTVPHYQVIIGGDYANLLWNSSVSINGVPANGATQTNAFLPMIRVAYRLNPKWVIGVDFNHPAFVDAAYLPNPIINQVATTAAVHSENINPRISYQVNDNLILGAGIDIMREWANLTAGGSGGAPLFTFADVDGWGVGYDAGASVILRKGTILSVAGFSPIKILDKGYSGVGPFRVDNSIPVITPTTFVLRLTQFMSPSWLVQFLGEWSENSLNSQLNFQNVFSVGRLVIPQWINNSFMLQLYTHHQFNKYWGFGLGGNYEDGIYPLATNALNFPIGNWYVLFAGPDLNINKVVNLQVVYAHLWSPSNMNYLSAAGPVIGNARLNVNVVDLRLTFQA